MDDFTTFRSSNDPVEFYLPATFQFRHAPGRIERILGRVFGWHGADERSTVASTGDQFYLPGTPVFRPSRSR